MVGAVRQYREEGAVRRCTAVGAVRRCRAVVAVRRCSAVGSVRRCSAVGAVRQCSAVEAVRRRSAVYPERRGYAVSVGTGVRRIILCNTVEEGRTRSAGMTDVQGLPDSTQRGDDSVHINRQGQFSR